MRSQTDVIKEALIVTLIIIGLMVISFFGYFLLFRLLEMSRGEQGTFFPITSLRTAYGALWILLCFVVYRLRVKDTIKAGFLGASLATLMIALGVNFYKSPIFVGLIVVGIAAISVIILGKKQPWYHYYAVLLSLSAALFYL